MPEQKPQFKHPQSQAIEPVVVGSPVTLDDVNGQVSALSSQIETMKNKRINFNTDLIGLFETVTVAPTGIPTSPYQQIKIALISGTTYLYIYDAAHPTSGSASTGWFRVTIA